MSKQGKPITTTVGHNDKPTVDTLLTDIRSVIERARQQADTAVNAAQTYMYWHVGQGIHTEFLGSERAPYGVQIVATVSRQLVLEYGRGFAEKNLRRMVQFAQAYPDEQIVVTLLRQLSWSHFLALLPLDKPYQRDFYAEMCRIEGWSVQPCKHIHLSRHSRESGNPAAEASNEATHCLHPRQSTQRHTLHWRHQQLGQTHMGTQNQSSRRLYAKVQRPSTGLLRATSGHACRNHAGKTTQEVEPILEIGIDRKEQSGLAQLVGRHCRLSLFSRCSRPGSRRSRVGGNPVDRCRAHWIPAYAGMTVQRAGCSQMAIWQEKTA